MKMSETKSAGPRDTARAGFEGGRVAAGFVAPVEAGERSEGGATATGPAQSLTPRGLFFANPTFHFETLRNAGYIVSNCADLGEIFETVKVISEGDPQSWYTEWEAAAERVLALAERTREPLSKGGAYMRASTYQRMAEFLLTPEDPRRP